MFHREEQGGKRLGYSLQHEHVFFFFGGSQFAREDLWAAYPEYEFAFLKQVHGKAVIEADPTQVCEGDAHVTRMATRALIVQTADCVPVLLASKNQICAIHAGWRGVAQNIIAESAASFRDEPVLFAAIGPHIMGPSFEVGHDVAAQLQAAAPANVVAQGSSAGGPGKYLVPHADKSKTYFDLTALVRDQIHAAFGAGIKLFECLHDTKSNTDFHSFRRDGKAAGRNYSFVVINS